MDELEFLRGVEGESSNEESLVVGAEHLLRLKRQVGMDNRRHDDLELNKEAHEIQPSERTDIPKSDFAQPHKEEAGHEGKYPIPDRQHARSALGFAKMHHDSSALAAVRAKIHQKFPGMLGGTEKDASSQLPALLGSDIASISNNHCPSCKKEKRACLCKMASILERAREKTAANTMDAVRGALKNNQTLRSAVLGGGVSGTIGAGMGAITSPTGDRVNGAVRGGWTGAMSGAGSGALYRHLDTKLAAMREKTAMSILDKIKNINPALLTTTGLGAVAGGLGTYLASKPQADTGKGRAEEELEGKVESQRGQPERGLLSKMHHRNTELEHGYAKAFREHPGKAALLGTVSGALGGYSLGRLAGAAAKMRGAQ